MIAQFSKLKIIQGPHFIDFRNFFKAKNLKTFVCPADTFDNVSGQFPIAFMIWDTKTKSSIDTIEASVFDRNGKELPIKTFSSYRDNQYINDWVKPFRGDKKQNQLIGKFPFKGNDFQNQNMIQIVHHNRDYNTEAGHFLINQRNVLIACIYFAIRHCIKATWLNDRDQFLSPNQGWETDDEFKSNCFAYTLFKNIIQSQYGTNHWIPFTESEVDAKERFESNFMSLFIAGKVNIEVTNDLFSKNEKVSQSPIFFGDTAQAVFNAGRQLWIYYHKQPKVNVNASLYDIKEYFQGRTASGRMNGKSEDLIYTELLAILKDKLKILASQIESKVYEYGFLLK